MVFLYFRTSFSTSTNTILSFISTSSISIVLSAPQARSSSHAQRILFISDFFPVKSFDLQCPECLSEAKRGRVEIRFFTEISLQPITPLFGKELNEFRGIQIVYSNQLH